jgi:hypothetical protein
VLDWFLLKLRQPQGKAVEIHATTTIVAFRIDAQLWETPRVAYVAIDGLACTNHFPLFPRMAFCV